MATRKKTLKRDKTSTRLRREVFCREYLIDFNATRAAREAGYSKKTAQMQGSRLLSNVMVQQKIQEVSKKRIAKTDLTIENTLIELARLLYSNIKDYVKHADDRFVYFKSIDDIPYELSAAIESLEQTEKGIKVKLHNKGKALELALRHFGLLNDSLKIRGAITHTHNVNMNKLRKAINAKRGKGNKRKS